MRGSAKPSAWMPIYWGDYMRDTGHLDAAGHGAYLMLIKHYWCTGGPISSDDNALCRIACCDSIKEWLKLKPKILPLFVVEGVTLRHKRIDKELGNAVLITEQRVLAGKASAVARKRQRDVNGRSILVDVPLEQNARPSPSPSPLDSGVPPESKSSLRSVAQPGLSLDVFDLDFWPTYPRKVGKDKARKCWASALKRGAKATDIIAGLKAYPFNPDPQYQPHASTWLEEGRWKIEADTPPPVPPPAPTPVPRQNSFLPTVSNGL